MGLDNASIAFSLACRMHPARDVTSNARLRPNNNKSISVFMQLHRNYISITLDFTLFIYHLFLCCSLADVQKLEIFFFQHVTVLKNNN